MLRKKPSKVTVHESYRHFFVTQVVCGPLLQKTPLTNRLGTEPQSVAPTYDRPGPKNTAGTRRINQSEIRFLSQADNGLNTRLIWFGTWTPAMESPRWILIALMKFKPEDRHFSCPC